MTTITAKIPPALAAKLKAAARSKRISKSEFIRQSLERSLKSNGKGRRPTFGELAGDLAGSFNGPTDLSTNPKWMEGYGA